jgi:hypothetical protein
VSVIVTTTGECDRCGVSLNDGDLTYCVKCYDPAATVPAQMLDAVRRLVDDLRAARVEYRLIERARDLEEFVSRMAS